MQQQQKYNNEEHHIREEELQLCRNHHQTVFINLEIFTKDKLVNPLHLNESKTTSEL